MTKNFKISTYLCLVLFISSCGEKTNETNNNFDRLSGENLFQRQFLYLTHSDLISEDIEIYILKNKDTFYNQYKLLKDSVIVKKESTYYDLNISKTDKNNIYKGIITLHSKYENLILDENNRREIQFGYYGQNKDSVTLNYVSSKNDNTLEFEYENYYNNKLQGILYQLVERDTIIDNEDMININRINLLVDNDTITDNYFFESYEIPKTKVFTLDKTKFKLKE